MRTSPLHDRMAVIALGAILLAPVSGCDVTANPFEFIDVNLSCDDESDPACAPSGVDAGSDAGNHRPCTTSLDCVGTDVCRSHICVPAVNDGGADGQVPPDAETSADAGCSDKIEVIPTSIDFGLVTKGCNSKNLSVVFENTGCTILGLVGFEVRPSTPFLVYSLPFLPVTLEPDGQAKFVFYYQPFASGGTESASLHLETSAGTLEVPLRGTATSSSDVLDSFVQGAPPSAAFQLSRWADPATINVKVNGAVIPGGGSNGWSYDADGNDVVFGSNAVPRSGDRIEIDYEAACF